MTDQIEQMFRDAGFPTVDTIVTSDPPVHRRYRSLVDKVFTPRRVRDMENEIAALVDKLIAAFPAEPFDFCDRFAMPLPMTIIGDQLGLKQDRYGDFKRWSDASVDMADPGRSPEKQVSDASAAIEMRTFFCGEFRRVREKPEETLLSALANTGDDTDALMSENELSYLLQILLAAGNETTTHAIGSAMLRLVQDSELQDRLRADPTLIPAFVEEVLRLDAPLQGLFRIATKDTSIGDVEIAKGSVINIRMGAGNRDPRQYGCVADVDLKRGRPTHLTFGFGIHHCIGSQLARSELRLAFEKLLAGSTSITIADVPDAIVSRPHFVAYGPRSLMIEFVRA